MSDRSNHLVTIHDRAAVGIRATIIAHNRDQGMVIERDAVLGPKEVIVLPNMTIDRGAMLRNRSLQRQKCRGIRARPVTSVEVPLGLDVSVKEFAKGLRSVAPASPKDAPKKNGTYCLRGSTLHSKKLTPLTKQTSFVQIQLRGICPAVIVDQHLR